MVHVGQQGVTPAVRQSIDDALRTRELVKLHIARQEGRDRKADANALAAELGADVVQIIGNTTTLYRENPELERKPGAPPPWRR
jgi:RNA-binding protein